MLICLICLGTYFIGCLLALPVFLFGSFRILSARNWFWPVIFLWPALVLWLACAGAKRFLKSKMRKPDRPLNSFQKPA
jgi:hypothetical protein